MPPIETAPTLLIVLALAGYLLGSIPFGIVITRAFGLGDLRKIGSGNIGATNVLRTGSKAAALATLILDAGKAAIAAFLGWTFGGLDAAQLAGLAAFAGHLFPVWLAFRGGKGVATGVGLLLMVAPAVGLIATAAWIATAAVTRISSLSALVAAAVTIPAALVLGRPDMVAMLAVLVLLLVLKHIPNIRRLAAGTEPRLGQKKETST